ncbi:MAG: hypothetical protein WAN65_23555 [Candidatus Sulfotelmatobacter sp.]
MPTDQKELVQHLLASRPGMTLHNIKFCRGDSSVIAPEEFAKQVCNAVDGRKVDAGTRAPVRSDLAPIDVRALVANMS